MKLLKRLVSMNFWYDVALRTTISTTLTQRGMVASDVRKTLALYRKLRRENRGLIQDIPSEYHVSWSSMIAALYLTLREQGKGVAEAIETTGALIFQNMGADSVAGYISSSLDKAKDKFASIVKSSKQQEVDFFGKTFDFYRPLDTDRVYQLRVRSCLYLDFFRENGLPELMAIACRWDMISWSKGIDPTRHGIVFSRPKTLGLDGVDCEFDFERSPGIDQT